VNGYNPEPPARGRRGLNRQTANSEGGVDLAMWLGG
jgi:hypothetical protein